MTNCSKSIVSELGGLANQKDSFGFQLKEKDRKPAPLLPPEVLFLLSFVLAIPDSSLLFLGSGSVLLSYCFSFQLFFTTAFGTISEPRGSSTMHVWLIKDDACLSRGHDHHDLGKEHPEGPSL